MKSSGINGINGINGDVVTGLELDSMVRNKEFAA